MIAIVYAICVVITMSLSLWPSAHGGLGLLAVILSLPWGLIVVLALDTLDRSLVASLGPPLVGLCGLFNAYLLARALRRGD